MDALLNKLTPAQQLQYLALPPEQQEYFRIYQERLLVRKENDIEQQQQIINQLMATAPQRMNFMEKMQYVFASQKKKEQMVANKAEKEATQMAQQSAAVAQQTEQLKERAEVQAIDAKKQQEDADWTETTNAAQAQYVSREEAIQKYEEEFGKVYVSYDD
jgi:DNA polymerase sigma